MITEPYIIFAHSSLETVPDEAVTAIYDSKIANDWQAVKALVQTEERKRRNIYLHGDTLTGNRRMDFYVAECGKGIEFQSGGLVARVFLNASRNEGYKSSFALRTGVGLLEKFNIHGDIERMAGYWTIDEDTGLAVFEKDDTLEQPTEPLIPDDGIRPYNLGYHLSRFMNKFWPDDLMVRPRKKAAISSDPFVPPQNL